MHKNHLLRSLLLAFGSYCLSTNALSEVQLLAKKVETIFEEVASLPVSISREKGNIQVRNKFDGDCMVSVSEAKVVDHHPEDFREFLENFSEAFPKVNPMARNVIPLEGNKDRQAVKTILKFPFPLTDRIMVHWKYLNLDRSPDEHMLIISERGNEDILAKHLTAEEKNKYVLARTFLSVYWIKPVYKENGELCGTNIKYAFSGDTGGSIPAWIQNTVGPKTALDSVKGLIDYVKKRAT